jgi:outer membrane biosynthesis protein TonB
VKVKVDKTLVASVALHVIVIGWGLVSFSTRAFESVEESLPVDVISADQLSKITAGLKTTKKNDPAPRVEKVAEAKPVDDAVGKISPKAPVVTETAPPPQPKVEEKPVEKKPDPPKPVAENKPKEEPKPLEKKPDPPKVDPIAEALKKEEKKPQPKPVTQAAKPPEPAKPKKEYTFDQSKMAALLDKRDPTRQSITGAALSDSDRLGALNRSDAYNSASWKSAFMQRVRQCFNFPYNGVDADAYFADIDIRLKPDGTVAVHPVIQGTRGPSAGVAKALGENAARAVIQCQPYSFLPKEQYASWQLIETTFGLKEFR